MGSVSLFSAAVRRLEGKVALITGGSSGIGESTAKLFAKHGAKVVIADIQDELGHYVCKEIEPESASIFLHCDVTQEKDVKDAVNTAVSKYGKLDIMFNNAGISGTENANIIDYDKAEFERTISVNLVGAFLGTKHAARVMIPARRGSIITTASVRAITGGVSAPHAYTSSKHGVLGLMKNTAAELGQYGIRVNCVSPYAVFTPLFKNFHKMDEDGVNTIYSNLKDAVLKAEDVAEAALYLGSDESKYVSGHNLVVDGGVTVSTPAF